MVLEEGTAVLSAEGEAIGEVAHVLAEPEEDIFDGIVVDASWLPGGHVFADSEQVDEIRTDAVMLRLDRAACRSLPQPSENPAALETGPGDTVKDDLGDQLDQKLRRAWDRISGNY